MEDEDINITMSPLPPTCRVVALDIVAMYLSIPLNEGLVAMRRALLRHGIHVMLTEYLVKGTQLVLESNVFWRNGRLYQQKLGTAIGMPLAPPYSGLYIAELEREAFDE